ncbi:lytic transglycosylase domain-containing protein [Vibrio chagasii]|uniref:Lytic transglycosylase domain-containing protein n=2 Tax=Vibrio chagasii TaxID=170679 RepID=A0A7V7NWZ2_9VIBR|nr:lytic transglycosylase domain-containing protein [Vibrio chagasii]
MADGGYMFEFLDVTALDALNEMVEPERSYYEHVIINGDTGLYKAMPWDSKRQILLNHKGEIEECTLIASHLNNIDPKTLRTVMRSENGWPGAQQEANNNSSDLGIAQVNPKVWDEEFRKVGVQLNWDDVRDDVCANLFVAGVILSRRLAQTDNVIEGIANYHRYATKDNKTFHYQYRFKAFGHYQNIEKEYGQWLKSQILTIR